LYGEDVVKLAKEQGIDPAEAAELIDSVATKEV
jgi:hypothetical protein